MEIPTFTVRQEGKDDCGLAVAKRAFLSRGLNPPNNLAEELSITPHQGTDNESLAQVLGKYFDCTVKTGTTVEEIQVAIKNCITVIVNILHPYANRPEYPEKENPFAEGFCETNPAGWDPSLGNHTLWDGHYVTVINIDLDQGKITIADPQDGKEHEMSIEEFIKLWRAYYNELNAWALFVGKPLEEPEPHGHAI